MKRIALFGGTGKTGKEFLQKALENEYHIKVLARSPEKVDTQSPHLEVIKGDVLNPATVNATVAGTDIAVSLFGHVKGSPKWLQSDGTSNILSAMLDHGVEKIISLSGGGLPFHKDEPKFADKAIRLIMKVAVPKVLNDAIRHAEILKDSDRKWVIVRGPRLTEEPEKGNYRVGWVGVNASTSIGRADLADFILKQVEEDTYIYKMPFISY